MLDEKSAWLDVVVVSDTVDGDADPGHLASRLRGSGFVDRTMGNALPSRQSCPEAARKGPTETAANWIGNTGNKSHHSPRRGSQRRGGACAPRRGGPPQSATSWWIRPSNLVN